MREVAEKPPACIVVAPEVLSKRHEHDRSCVCLGDGQTEAEGLPSQGGRGDALLYPTYECGCKSVPLRLEPSFFEIVILVTIS